MSTASELLPPSQHSSEQLFMPLIPTFYPRKIGTRTFKTNGTGIVLDASEPDFNDDDLFHLIPPLLNDSSSTSVISTNSTLTGSTGIEITSPYEERAPTLPLKRSWEGPSDTTDDELETRPPAMKRMYTINMNKFETIKNVVPMKTTPMFQLRTSFNTTKTSTIANEIWPPRELDVPSAVLIKNDGRMCNASNGTIVTWPTRKPPPVLFKPAIKSICALVEKTTTIPSRMFGEIDEHSMFVDMHCPIAGHFYVHRSTMRCFTDVYSGMVIGAKSRNRATLLQKAGISEHEKGNIRLSWLTGSTDRKSGKWECMYHYLRYREDTPKSKWHSTNMFKHTYFTQLSEEESIYITYYFQKHTKS